MKEIISNSKSVFLFSTLSRRITLAVGLASLCLTNLFSQTPSPTPQDKRGLGLENNPANTSQTDQSKSREAKPELVLQTGYNNFFGATRLIFSPDGRLLATATFRSSTIKLWETATGRELRDLSTGGQNTNSLAPVFAFSPDGRFLAAAAGNNSVKVWDVTTGGEVQTLSGTQASFMAALGVSFIAFSADGKKLVTMSDALRIWEVPSWRELKTIETTSLSPSSFTGGQGGLALSNDGNQLARVEAGGSKITVLDLVTGREARSINLESDLIDSLELCFTSDGRLIAAGIVEKRLKVWDLTAKQSGRDLTPTTHDFSKIQFSPDGRFVALSEGYTVKAWEAATGRALTPLNIPNIGVFAENGGVFLGFSNDGKRVATGGFGTQTLVWDTETGKQVQQMKGRSNPSYSVSFNADGTQLISGGRTRWDLRTGRGLRLTPSPSEKLFGMPSPDGKLVAMFAPNNNAITILETTTGRPLQTLTRMAPSGGVERVYFSPDGHLLVAVYMQDPGSQSTGNMPATQSDVKIWDVNSGRELQTLTLGTAPNEVGFSADGRVLATVGGQGEVALWDVASGSRLRNLTSSPMANLTSLPNLGSMPNPRNRGSMPTMPTMPNMADISAMMTNVLGTMTAGTMGRSITSVAFTSDGRMLATGGVESKSNFDMASMMSGAMNPKASKNKKPPDPQDMLKDIKVEAIGQIVFWDTASGQQIGAIKGHGKGVTSVAFSRDSKLVASSSTDNTIKIWDVTSKRELRTLTGHTSNIESLDFSPDGRLLASASDDGGTFLWDVSTGQHLLTLVSLDDGGEWIVVTPEGLFDGTPGFVEPNSLAL